MKSRRDSRRLPEAVEKWILWPVMIGAAAGLLYWIGCEVWAWVGW